MKFRKVSQIALGCYSLVLSSVFAVTSIEDSSEIWITTSKNTLLITGYNFNNSNHNHSNNTKGGHHNHNHNYNNNHQNYAYNNSSGTKRTFFSMMS